MWPSNDSDPSNVPICFDSATALKSTQASTWLGTWMGSGWASEERYNGSVISQGVYVGVI